VGTIYAVSTVGSIVGTFLTGFWLISWFGTRMIVWGVGGSLLLIGLAVGDFLRPRRGLGIVALTGLGVAAAVNGRFGGASVDGVDVHGSPQGFVIAAIIVGAIGIGQLVSAWLRRDRKA
jgi:hypothetical protein